MSHVTDDLLVSIHGEKIAVPGIVHLHCQSCGETLTDVENTGKALQAGMDLYRRKHHLLLPGQIAALRKSLSLSHADMARVLRAHSRTVSAWEIGKSVQTPLQDAVLRMLDKVPGTLRFLRKRAA